MRAHKAMTLESWSTLFSGLTFVVIAATAAAAVIQLRHLRASNQLTALITILEDWQKRELQQQLHFVRGELPAKLADPKYLSTVVLPIDRKLHPWLDVCDYFEQLGSYMRYGLMDRDSYLSVSCFTVSSLYRQLEPCIDRYRDLRNNETIYENFEYLAVLGCQWIQRHPNGDWPHGVPRWKDVEKAARI